MDLNGLYLIIRNLRLTPEYVLRLEKIESPSEKLPQKLWKSSLKSYGQALLNNPFSAIYTLSQLFGAHRKLPHLHLYTSFSIQHHSAPQQLKILIKKPSRSLLKQPLLQFKFNNDFQAPLNVKRYDYSVTERQIENCLSPNFNPELLCT